MDINQFFNEFSVADDEIYPDALKYNFQMLNAISRSFGDSYYVIDYNKKGFIYMACNPIFLCGYQINEILNMGYYFYEKVVHPDDLLMLLEINQKGFELFHSKSKSERINLTISYDFRMIHKQIIMVNHKLTPIILSKTGEIWLALCTLSLSVKPDAGNVFIRTKGLLYHYSYSFESKKWKETEIISLTEREKEVLMYSIQGLSNGKIADKLFVDVNTVKFHKRNLFEKFNVKNITEAITFAYSNFLL